MEVEYYEIEGEKFVSLVHGRQRITARREGGRGRGGFVRVNFSSCAGNECDRIDVAFDDCFSCEDWERLLCELGRVCGYEGCEPCGDWLFDRDDDEHDDCGCGDGVRMSVREIRKTIKGLGADDVVVFGGDED